MTCLVLYPPTLDAMVLGNSYWHSAISVEQMQVIYDRGSGAIRGVLLRTVGICPRICRAHLIIAFKVIVTIIGCRDEPS